MLKALLSFLALAIVLVTVSFAGLALQLSPGQGGVGGGFMEAMNHSPITASHAMDCHGADCLTQSSSTADALCLDHCLSAATNQTNAVTPVAFYLLSLIVFVLLIVFSILPTTNYLLPTTNLHPPFASILRHRHLATVLIRD
ncbi:TPA: hypothetical protein DEP96_04310 [Candidatus Uhrbacteria bacterium]|nr:hypothetical protein [Candidatus Uhrbacteria bacterium]